MVKLIYSYLPQAQTDQVTGGETIVYRPKIFIRFSYMHGNPTNLIEALIDSGADRSLLPVGIAEILKINLKKAKKVRIYGIGGSEIVAYPSKVNIWVDNKKYETEADFSLQQQTPLLGRKGFFDLFKKISFDEMKKLVEIET